MDDRRLRVHHDPDAAIRGRLAHRRGSVGGDVAEIDRHGSSAIAPESERASSSRSSTIDVMCPDLVVDVLERRADRRDRLVAMPLEVFDAAPDHGQRRPQFVAGIGREVALSAEGDSLGGQRLADRHERPPGVDRPEAEGDEDDDRAPAEQHHEHHLSSVRCSAVRSWTTWTV